MNEWNFHGYIAVPLEEYGNSIIGSTCLTADEIERVEFVEAMLQILSAKYGNLEEVSDFTEKCRAFAELPAREIPEDKAKELFEDFKRLLNAREM